MILLFGRLYAPENRGPSLVSVDGDRVSEIRPTDAAPAGALGGPGARILPGLVDIQLNGAFGHDFGDPGADLDSVCRGLPHFGVTAFVPTIVTSPPGAYAPALANLRRAAVPGGARVLGVHLEGPFLSPKYPGAHDPALLRLPSREEAAAWLEAGDVRYVTLAPELPGALELARFLMVHGVRIAVGHSDATWAEAEAGAEAGIGLGTHVFNALRPIHHREPGLIGYLLASQLPVGIVADGHHLAFETIQLVARIKAPNELVVVSDALSGLGVPPGQYELAGRTYDSDGTCGRLPDGTLAGSLLPLHRALRNLVERAGLAPSLAVRLATLNPARALGLDGAMGRIEVGRRADLVVVDEAWEVVATLIGGVVA
jgi:N-acetylglucosamine-6-phosphate deacetylase